MTRAAIYLRISKDSTGEGLAVERQRDACEAIVAERGWTAVETYTDAGISAYARSVARPAYDRLIADAEAGRFDAVVTWDLDRLTRQPEQLERWITLAEDQDISLVTANGEADLATDAGRMFARIKAAVARSEMERKSARQKAANAQRRTRGIPMPGARPFGFEPDRITPREAEAAWVRQAFDMLLQGRTLYSIGRALIDNGVATPRGGQWSSTTVRKMLQRPINVGLLPDGSPSTTTPLVSQGTYDEAMSILSSRAGKPGRKASTYWLSSVARCQCGAGMRASMKAGKPYYVCRTSSVPHTAGVPHTAMRQDALEAVVTERIEAAVGSDELRLDQGAVEQRKDLRDRIAALTERQARAQEALLDGLGDPAAWRRAIREADAALASARSELDRLTLAGAGVDALLMAWGDFADDESRWKAYAEADAAWDAWWTGLDVDQRQALARAVGPITVHQGRGPDRVHFG